MSNFGAALACAIGLLVVLWGGSYIGHQIPDDHWAGFPFLVTSVLVIFVCAFACVFFIAAGLDD